jgi:hypothetical protein
VNGAPGIVMAPRGKLVTVMMFKVENERIVEIEVVNDPARQRELDLAVSEPDPTSSPAPGQAFSTSPLPLPGSRPS